MERRFANAVVRIPDQAPSFCAALTRQQTELTSDELRELQGGSWIQLVRWAVTTLASFEAGYQYGGFRDGLKGSPAPEAEGPSSEERPELRPVSLQTAAPDNTRVGG